MRVRYVGPYPRVELPTVGVTATRDVPVDVPDGLVLGADWVPVEDPSDMTVAELRAALDGAGVEIPKGAKRADLLELLEPPTSED